MTHVSTARALFVLTERPTSCDAAFSPSETRTAVDLACCKQYSYPTHLFEAVDEALPVDPLQAVAADVEVDEPEAGLHVVVVSQLLDAVVPEVEPEQRLGDEGVVEPLQQVVRHVEPLQVVLRVQQPVQLLQPVVVQSEGLQEKE